MRLSTLLILLIWAATVIGQDRPIQFNLLRQQDELPVWNDTTDYSFYQRLKTIRPDRKIQMSVGGSYRFQIESFIHEQFDNTQDQTDYWFLNRAMVHFHLKMDRKFELFGELNSSTIASKANLSPVDKDELSINQLFAKFNLRDNLSIRIGRQNMRLGSGRLVDVREGPNVRLSFDMAHIQFQDVNTQLQGFFAVPVRQEAGLFDNEYLNFSEYLSGLNLTKEWKSHHHTDLYVLYKQEAEKSWNVGTSDDKRLSIGIRYFGTWKSVDYNNEFIIQVGEFGEQRIRAWTLSFDLEKTVNWFRKSFVLGLKTEAISGDREAADQTLNTFDALYPRGAYFGRVARFGPSNLVDIHPSVSTAVGAVDISVDYVAFWRFSVQDGVHNPAMIVDYPAVNTRRFIGHQIGTITGWEVNPYVVLELETNTILPGGFLIESQLNEALFHTVFTAEVKW